MSLISCRDAVVGYDGHAVLEDVSLTLNAGEYLCIVGENGSGKSTLIQGLLHLKAPMEGAVTYGDGLAPHEIGYLPQQTDYRRDFPASVYEVVLSGCLNRLGARPFYSRSHKAEARHSMELLDVLPLRHRSFHALSGGQRQRVLLARALCATEKVLLLDEPAAGLDPLVTTELYKVIHHLNRDHGVAIIMVSHDPVAVREHATHVLHLGGRPLFFGTKEMYLQSEIGRRFMGGDGHV